MYIGTQFGCRHDTDIEVLSQLGVLNVDQTPSEPWTEWTTDTLTGMRERFDKYGINLEMINQGSSEVSMMFGVKEVDVPAAVRSLYAEFFTLG